MTKTEIKTTTYEYDAGYYIDIVEKSEEYEAFIYHKDYGIKLHMFGMPKSQQDYTAFLDIVEANAGDYIKDYKEEYED